MAVHAYTFAMSYINMRRPTVEFVQVCFRISIHDKIVTEVKSHCNNNVLWFYLRKTQLA